MLWVKSKSGMSSCGSIVPGRSRKPVPVYYRRRWGVAAEAQHGPREVIQVLGVDPKGMVGLDWQETGGDVPASPYEGAAVDSPIRLLLLGTPPRPALLESRQITGGDRLNSLEGGYCSFSVGERP